MKKIFIFIYICLTAVSMKGQTADELFISMPESMLLTLSETNRLDLIDLYKAGQKAEVINLLEDSCVILNLSDNYLEIKAGNYKMELLVLTLVNDSKIVCLIQTVCAPVCDSSLAFYTTNWKKLNADLFFAPAGISGFLKENIQPDEQKVKNALTPLDISLMQFHFDREKQELLQYYNTPEYVSQDDRKKAEVFLKDSPLIFKWNQTRFESPNLLAAPIP
jgi:hypothetical protein